MSNNHQHHSDNTHNQIEIYPSPDGQSEISVRLESDTVWLSQAQMVELFGRDKSVTSRHISSVFKEGELSGPPGPGLVDIVSRYT